MLTQITSGGYSMEIGNEEFSLKSITNKLQYKDFCTGIVQVLKAN